MTRSGGKGRKVVFLDRDGALVADKPGFYLLHPDKLHLYRNTPKALKLLRDAGYTLVIVTNQSGIGRGWITHEVLGRIHAKLRGLLKRHGVTIDAIYYCPHAPEQRCRCRKPMTVLPRRAVREMGLSLEGAAIIGDKRADVDMGRRLGITSIHLGTGHGKSQRAKYGRALKPSHSTSNILTAARWLIKHGGAA
ncbi:MAG: HAD family hydrolase [Elusimicrobia bacterium]|nr:HAD family hydrolase [Elusimicrobiota bacterium]